MYPVLPTHIVYFIERYKLQIALVYCMVCAMILWPLLGMAGKVQAAQVIDGSYQPISYPIINKIPSPTSSLQTGTSTAAVGYSGPSSSTSVWPIHGKVTTQFGASDAPFQSSHTGIDISSTKPTGVSAVVAFRDGMVMKVVHGSSGFGNHVIIDHGGGLTSLYGHLYDTAVHAGQLVHAGDIIGHEGSTGASTGPHVHFETDLNGKPVNPRRYVIGNP